MRTARCIVMVVVVAGCARASATNVRQPLAARLSSGARTGAVIPLRYDSNTKVILSNASALPAASFAAAQAARGKDLFEGSCATCHETAKFVGRQFVESWNDRRTWDLYSLVRGTMPLDNPGGLKEREYVDLVAYLLQANHAAPGADSLRADTAAMRRTKIAVRFP